MRPSDVAAAPLRPRFLVQRDQEAPRAAPWALFRARRRRWARAVRPFFFFWVVLLSPFQSTPQKKSDFFKYGILRLWRRGLSAIEAHSKVPLTDFCFRIALDFAENGPLLHLPSGY